MRESQPVNEFGRTDCLAASQELKLTVEFDFEGL
jgi:hypothetical protein